MKVHDNLSDLIISAASKAQFVISEAGYSV